MIVPGPTWVDVQMSEVRGQRSVRVRRYGLSREQIRTGGARAMNPLSPAPLSRWTLDEVKDASRKTAPEVLQAALVEAGTKFPLSGRTLVELKKAGVADTVIDVMVALTFPEKFVIDRPTYNASYGGGGGAWGAADSIRGRWPATTAGCRSMRRSGISITATTIRATAPVMAGCRSRRPINGSVEPDRTAA